MTSTGLPLLTPLPVETLVPGDREHTNHHKIIHAWLNAHGDGFGTGGGTSRVLARWEWRDTVMPSRSTTEAVDDDASIGAITFSLLVPPKRGRHILWDVMHLTGEDAPVSIFGDETPPPILADTPNVRGLYTLTFDTPYNVKAGDALYSVVSDGASARWMVMKLLAASITGTSDDIHQAHEHDTANAGSIA